jgi:hypothetical protein
MNFEELLTRWRASGTVALLIVFIAFFLDTILFTCVSKFSVNCFTYYMFIIASYIAVIAPILPDYIFRLEHADLLEQWHDICTTNISTFDHDQLNAEQIHQLSLLLTLKAANTTSEICRRLQSSPIPESILSTQRIQNDLNNVSGRISFDQE